MSTFGRTLSMRSGGPSASFGTTNSSSDTSPLGPPGLDKRSSVDKRSSLTRLQQASVTAALQAAAAAPVPSAASAPSSDADNPQLQPKSDSSSQGGEADDAHADGADGGDDDLASMGGFVKTLSSDLNEAESLVLLQRVQAAEPLFRGFDASELEMLARVLSVLHFAEGDKIISRGENATFCGLILNGTFNAVVSPTLNVPLALGSMIGEMSYFEGGVRNADVIAATDAVLAVITFGELDNLQSSAPRLQNKLIRALGQASLGKVRTAASMSATGAPGSGQPMQGGGGSKSGASTSKPSTAGGSSHPPMPGAKIAGAPAGFNKGNHDYLEEQKIESLYRGRLQRQKQTAAVILESEKQSRLLAERQQNRQAAIVRELNGKNKDLLAELEALRREMADVRYTQETESRMAQRTILGLQEENAKVKIKFNQEVLQRQDVEDQLSHVLENMQVRHLKAVSLLRAGVPSAKLDPEEEKVLARIAAPKAKSVLLTDDSAAASALSSPLVSPRRVIRNSSDVKRQFRQLTKLALTRHHKEKAKQAQMSLKQINVDLHERLQKVESEQATMEALRESSFQASVSYELNRKRMLSRLEMANAKIKAQKVELDQLKLILRTVVVTRTVKDFKTKRNLIALAAKAGDMFLYTLERVHHLLPNSFHAFLLSTEETENSSTLGGGGAGGSVGPGVQSGEKTASSAVVTVAPPTASNGSTTTSSSNPAAVQSSSSVSSLLASLTPTPFPSSLSTSLRSAAEELSLLRERKRQALREMIARKARSTHGEMIQTLDAELERFARLTAQTHQALGYYHNLSTTLSARVVDLTSQLSDQTTLLNSVLSRFVSLRNAQELRSLEVRAHAEQAQESALLKQYESTRMERHLGGLQREVEERRKEKAKLEEEIYERVVLQESLQAVEKATGGTTTAKAAWIAPHYAVEESKQDASSTGQPLLRSGSSTSRGSAGGMTTSVHRGIRLSPPETDSSTSQQSHSSSQAWLRASPSSPRTLLHHRALYSQPTQSQSRGGGGGPSSARATTGEVGSPMQRSSTAELSQTAPIVKDSSGAVLPLPPVAVGSQQPGDVSARASTASLNTTNTGSATAPAQRRPLLFTSPAPPSTTSSSMSPRASAESARLAAMDPVSRMHLQMASLVEGRQQVQAAAANRPANTVHLPLGNRRPRARQPSISGGLQDSYA